MLLLWEYFVLGFSALLPLVNPLGSALVFLGLVGISPPHVYRALARKIAINLVIFFAVVELVGSALLSFFGISLPIVQVSGGIVLAAMGWSLLNEKSAAPNPEKIQAGSPVETPGEIDTLTEKAFYPFTFPVTAGPGSIVVMLTLSVHGSQGNLTSRVLSHVGLLIAAIVLSALVYLCYAYAPRITRSISPSTAHGILRVVAFILLCIGVQIAWNGLSELLKSVVQRT
ncbi:MAG: multiple antibiotic resistance (MarC)-related protein [Edaphobacter sp.]|jgi:multiple antibiotic resistance protein|nr:multiple antibiotic resistance (MarC)-related protein [Edaphobacter sp.]MCU1318494.1 multiple antibiotic resistance (MarC)-related protein [Edaphobacter sp.]